MWRGVDIGGFCFIISPANIQLFEILAIIVIIPVYDKLVVPTLDYFKIKLTLL